MKRNEQVNTLEFLRNNSLLDEVNGLLELINEGKTLLFNTQLNITIRAEDTKQLDLITDEIAGILGRRRITWSIDSRNAAGYWFSRMPFNDLLARPLKLVNSNIAALWTFYNAPAGQPSSPWGNAAMRLLRTPSGQTYPMNIHLKDSEGSAGHTLVFAPTGGGKSTLILHLLSGLAKFPNVRSYIFDSNEGTRFMTECFGGHYQSLGNLTLNPLDVEDTPENRTHIINLLRTLCPSISDNEIDLVLKTTFTIPREHRSLNNIFTGTFGMDVATQKEMARWVVDVKENAGLYSNVFNAPHDSLSGAFNQSYLTAIDIADAMSDEVLAAPLVTHITQSISKFARSNNQGFCIFIDEAANLLQNDGFAKFAAMATREYRKLNGAVIMAFQDPEALFRTSVSSAILGNVQTLIFFPDSNGSTDVYEKFNLNAEEIQFLTSGHAGSASRRSVLVVKRDGATGFRESVILDIDLNALGSVVKYYRSGSEANSQLKQQQEWGEQWRERI